MRQVLTRILSLSVFLGLGSAAQAKSLLFIGGGSAKIEVYAFDRSNGNATFLKRTKTPGVNPSFLAIDSKNKRLFAANEIPSGGVKSFGIAPETGVLTEAGEGSLEGGATHVSIDPSGRFVFAASYSSGHIASFPINADGSLATAVSDLYAGQNAHQILSDRSGGTVLVPCLGSNFIAQYTFDSETGILNPKEPATLSTEAGGPRHIAFHPIKDWAYLMYEYSSRVQALELMDAQLSLLGSSKSALLGNVGWNSGAEIQVHPSGKYVYSSNRGDNSIALFDVEADGSVQLKSTTKTGGFTPRHFSIDARGEWLFVANQDSHQISAFKIDSATGELQPTALNLPFAAAQFVELVDFVD